MPENNNSRWLSTQFDVWTRIFPRCRSRHREKTNEEAEKSEDKTQDERVLDEGMQAVIADPLWMLARQWQMGELLGEDTGSATHVEVTYHQEQFNAKYQAENSTANSVPPMEVQVERESIGWDWRSRVQAGQQLERLIYKHFAAQAAGLIDNYRVKYGLKEPDEADMVLQDYNTQRFITLMTGRVIDGEQIVRLFAIERRTMGRTNLIAFQKVMRDYRAWADRLFTIPNPRQQGTDWNHENLAYEFSAIKENTTTNTVIASLDAPAYQNGELDWYTFDAHSIDDTTFDTPNSGTRRLPMTPIRYSGMPNQRWWAFEDYNIHYSGMETNASDLLKLLMLQFANHYSNDWASVPITVPIGSLVRINSVSIKDVFGQDHTLDSIREEPIDDLPQWGLYRQAQTDTGQIIKNLLYTPPVVIHREETGIKHALEEVHFVRDEGANMVWAIEQRVPNAMGIGVEAFNYQRERRERQRLYRRKLEKADEDEAIDATNTLPGDNIVTQEIPVYRLASSVPDNYIPFIPRKIDDIRKLQLAEMLRGDVMEPNEPMSSLLKLGETEYLRFLNEQSVSRSGVKVLLTKQRIRWIDGETYVWLGRKVLIGRGECSSGLRFDAIGQAFDYGVS